MKRTSTEIQNPINNQQNQPSQSIAIQIACLSFFPVVYFVGKTVVAFMG